MRERERKGENESAVQMHSSSPIPRPLRRDAAHTPQKRRPSSARRTVPAEKLGPQQEQRKGRRRAEIPVKRHRQMLRVWTRLAVPMRFPPPFLPPQAHRACNSPCSAGASACLASRADVCWHCSVKEATVATDGMRGVLSRQKFHPFSAASAVVVCPRSPPPLRSRIAHPCKTRRRPSPDPAPALICGYRGRTGCRGAGQTRAEEDDDRAEPRARP